MIVAAVVLIVSVFFFIYWFRYVCLLILESRREGRAAQEMASRIRLHFFQVDRQLEENQPVASLDRLEVLLQEDYRLLRDVLDQSAGGRSIENQLMALDYHVLRLWYRLTRVVAPVSARASLRQMSRILGFFATVICEESGT
ncbi:MAG: hypothetical protein IPM24_06480 [Bryobacterales bacterium]|nr:hypothetical protein [Bryobacterales bacterium]